MFGERSESETSWTPTLQCLSQSPVGRGPLPRPGTGWCLCHLVSSPIQTPSQNSDGCAFKPEVYASRLATPCLSFLPSLYPSSLASFLPSFFVVLTEKFRLVFLLSVPLSGLFWWKDSSWCPSQSNTAKSESERVAPFLNTWHDLLVVPWIKPSFTGVHKAWDGMPQALLISSPSLCSGHPGFLLAIEYGGIECPLLYGTYWNL